MSRDIVVFEYELEANLLALANDLQTGQYQHGGYRFFEVNDNKRRLVAVASVRDRVVHRLLYEYLVGIYEKTFVYDVWSCRSGKGLTAAIERVQHFSRVYSNGYLWRSDMRKFFDSVDHTRLKEIIRRRVFDRIALNLIDSTIDSYTVHDKTTGLPIGNLTSQVYANIYLAELDRYIVHSVRPLGYVRYGDDIVAWCEDKEVAQKLAQGTIKWLTHELRLQTNQANTVIQPVRKRLHFCGVDIWPNGRRLDRRMASRITDRISYMNLSSYAELVSHHDSERRKIQLYYCIMDDDALASV